MNVGTKTTADDTEAMIALLDLEPEEDGEIFLTLDEAKLLRDLLRWAIEAVEKR